MSDDREAMKSLYQKWHGMMSEVKHVEKTGTMRAGSTSFEFVEASVVVGIMHDLLVKHRLNFLPEITGAIFTEGQTKNGTTSYHWVLDLRITIADIDTGAELVREWKGESIDFQDKGIGKALTLCLKYWWLQAMLLGSGGEPDPDGVIPQEAPIEHAVKQIKRTWTDMARELRIIPDHDQLSKESADTLKEILGDAYPRLAQTQEPARLRQLQAEGLVRLLTRAAEEQVS